MSSLTDPFPSLHELPVIHAGDAPRPFDDGAHRQAVERGYAEGVRRGYEDGRAAAEADARNDVSFALTALHSAIEGLAHRDAAGLMEVSAEAVELALAIAEVVIGREIATSLDPGRDALVRALALAPDRGTIVARFHPADLHLFGDLDALDHGRDLQLVADAGVSRGGCILDVGSARVDAQIGPALARVRAELTEGELVREDAAALESLWQEDTP